MAKDRIRHVSKGDKPKARDYNLLIDLAKKLNTGAGAFVDSFGVHLRPLIRNQTQFQAGMVQKRFAHVDAVNQRAPSESDVVPMEWDLSARQWILPPDLLNDDSEIWYNPFAYPLEIGTLVFGLSFQDSFMIIYGGGQYRFAKAYINMPEFTPGDPDTGGTDGGFYNVDLVEGIGFHMVDETGDSIITEFTDVANSHNFSGDDDNLVKIYFDPSLIKPPSQSVGFGWWDTLQMTCRASQVI